MLEHLPEELLNRVEEITLDMADSMRKIVRRCFPKAIRVIDRFHVQKLAHDALQEMRIAHRWDTTNQETEAKEQAKLADEKYIPNCSKMAILTSNFLPEAATCSSNLRTNRLKNKNREPSCFLNAIPTKEGYSLTHSLRMIFSKNTVKDVARLSFARWYNQVAESKCKSFNTIAATVYEH